jgi:pheromone a factor receptor
VSSSRKVQFDSVDRRRRIIFESVLCFGVPLMSLRTPLLPHRTHIDTYDPVDYIVQGHRFDISENTGCQAALYISVPGVLLTYFPPLLFSVITHLRRYVLVFIRIIRVPLIYTFVRFSHGSPSLHPSPPYLRRPLTELQFCSDDKSLPSAHRHGRYRDGLGHCIYCV